MRQIRQVRRFCRAVSGYEPDVVLLLSLLAIPGLMALALLLERLEEVFAHQEIADEIARLIANEMEIEQLERSIARAAEPLLAQFRG